MIFELQFGHFIRGNNQGGERAEAQKHNRSIFVRKVYKSAVIRKPQLVEIFDAMKKVLEEI